MFSFVLFEKILVLEWKVYEDYKFEGVQYCKELANLGQACWHCLESQRGKLFGESMISVR